jgi:hypothetical protein
VLVLKVALMQVAVWIWAEAWTSVVVTLEVVIWAEAWMQLLMEQ